MIRAAGFIAALIGLSALSAAAETQVVTTRYACDRGVEVPVTLVTAEDQAVAVLHVDGRQITLYLEAGESGARYGWPSGGSNYVWMMQDATGTLLWKTPEGETPLLGCTQIN